MAAIKVWNGSAWVQPNVKHYSGAAWVDHETKYWTGSAWETLEAASGPIVSARADGRSNSNLNPPNTSCRVGCQFSTNGLEYELTSTGGLTNSTTWLDSGSNADVWVEFIRTGGTKTAWDSLANNTRYNLGTTRTFYLDDFQAGSESTIIGYFRFWDAASGGNQLQQTGSATWYAWNEFQSCPLCCFTPDTLVTTARGLAVPIASLRAGDEIMVMRNGEIVSEPVGEVIVRINRPMILIQFSDGTQLKASTDHPIDVKDVGPAAFDFIENPYKDLEKRAQLLAGMEVTTERGDTKTIDFIAKIEHPGPVYSLSNETFFANGFLVY